MNMSTTAAHTAVNHTVSLTGSQIFLMQLGFLLFEAAFVEPVWRVSIIIKNVEDTVIGMILYIIVGFSIAESTSYGGIIGSPIEVFRNGISLNEYSVVFISAAFAVSCATIMSGAVLERMKNKAYVAWVVLVLLVNYNITAHWVWNSNGWLRKLGFVDSAGSLVIHVTGGIGGTVASWYVGKRHRIAKGELSRDMTQTKMTDPIYGSLGVFLLWYGWFAFNVATADARHVANQYNDGVVGLLTLISPCAAATTLILYEWFKTTTVNVDNIFSCILGGLVAVTAPSATIPWWSGFIVGIPVPFALHSARFLAKKINVDDPLDILGVHVLPGILGGVMEGVFNRDKGLVRGGGRHFGIQLLGTVTIVGLNVILCLVMMEVMMKRVLFRNTTLKVTILNQYLGTKLYMLAPKEALDEMLSCQTNLSKQVLFYFHAWLHRHQLPMQYGLDFLLVTTDLTTRLHDDTGLMEVDDLGGEVDAITQMFLNEESLTNVPLPSYKWKDLYSDQDEAKSRESRTSRKHQKFEEIQQAALSIHDAIIPDLLTFLKAFRMKKKTVKRADKMQYPFSIRPDKTVIWREDYDETDILSKASPPPSKGGREGEFGQQFVRQRSTNSEVSEVAYPNRQL